MTAQNTALLTDRILGAITRSTSQHPANAADVLARVGGDEVFFWAAIEQLTRERRINSAHIHRPATDPAPWLGIWPTGICLPPPPMSGRHLSGLFVPRRHHDLRSAGAPRTAPKPAPQPVNEEPPMIASPAVTAPATPAPTPATPHLNAAERRDLARKHIAGRTRDNAIALADLAEQLQITPKGLQYIAECLAGEGVAERVVTGTGNKRKAWLYDPRTEWVPDPEPAPPAAEAPPAAPAACNLPAGLDAIADALALDEHAGDHIPGITKMVEQPTYRHDDIRVRELVAGEADSTIAAEPRFGLWDDGSLTIIDDDVVLQYKPDIVARLALLLGVPGAEARS